jgi:hypothetical protein
LLKQGSPNLREVFGTSDRASRREGRLEAKTASDKEKNKKIPLFGKELLPLQPEFLGST